MERFVMLLAAWLCGCTVLMAQPDSTAKKKAGCSCAFSSINLLGVLEGERGSYFQFQTINGLRYKSWFAGIGAGLDMYPTSGIPVFVDLRKYILTKKNTPFVYADAGLHFADFHRDETQWEVTEYNNGAYYEGGAGYKFGLPKRGGLLLSIGYSYKAVEKRISYPQPNCGACSQNINRYHYQLNRLSIKAGWQL